MPKYDLLNLKYNQGWDVQEPEFDSLTKSFKVHVSTNDHIGFFYSQTPSIKHVFLGGGSIVFQWQFSGS